MKSVLLSLIAIAMISTVCGCTQRPCAPVAGPVPSNPGQISTPTSSDQPIKGHDGKMQTESVVADIGSVKVDILTTDATPVYSADNKIRKVEIVAKETRTITLTDVLIDGILYGAAGRQIDTPWTIALRDRKHRGIIVAIQNPTPSGQNVILKTEDGDYFDATTIKDVTTYSLHDQKCHGQVNCQEFDSIEVKAAHSKTVVYRCGNHKPGTTCAIDIGMLSFGR